MNWLTKTVTSQPVKLAVVSAGELFIETVACAVAASIIEDMKHNREPGKVVRLFRNKEDNNVQLHNQSEQTETTSG